jgi:hypothetical protein
MIRLLLLLNPERKSLSPLRLPRFYFGGPMAERADRPDCSLFEGRRASPAQLTCTDSEYALGGGGGEIRSTRERKVLLMYFTTCYFVFDPSSSSFSFLSTATAASACIGLRASDCNDDDDVDKPGHWETQVLISGEGEVSSLSTKYLCFAPLPNIIQYDFWSS